MVSAILTALAVNVDMLLFARTLDGIQGAATGTASGALISMVFSPQERVKAMGWWSLVGAGGPVIGVSLGSPIIAAFGWRALFWFQLGLIAFTAAVMGGIGNLQGAVLGAVIIGLIQGWNDGLPIGLGQQWSNTVVFSILILLMVFKPTGLLGKPTTEKV